MEDKEPTFQEDIANRQEALEVRHDEEAIALIPEIAVLQENRNQMVKWFRIMWFSNAIIIALIVGIGIIGSTANRHRAAEGQKAREFLCIQRDDLEDRINRTQNLLDGRIPVTGELQRFLKDPAARAVTIQNQARDRKTLKNMDKTLQCP